MFPLKMIGRSYVRRAFNSVLPSGVHALLSPYYRRRRENFHADWSEKTNASERHRPEHYTEIDRKTVLLADWVEKYAGRDASVLDLCCNSGRNLVELWRRGFRDLHGVDINRHAIEHSKRYAPDIQGDAKLVAAPLEEYLPGLPAKGFDVCISRGTSVEYVAPDFPLVREICRVTRRYCILHLKPSAPPYPRFWGYEFRREGFALAELYHYEEGGTCLQCFAGPGGAGGAP